MLPQFFEVWNDGKPALQQQWLLRLGEPVQGLRDGRSGDYVLVELSKIHFQGKALDNRRVNLVSQEEQPEVHPVPFTRAQREPQATQERLLEDD